MLAIVAGAPALAEAPGLAFALSETDVDVDGSSAVYDSFATGAWQTAAFVTAHRHENVKGQKFSHNTVEFGQVDLCKATSPGKAASAKEQTLASLDCNCDDCASSCGVKDSRKADSCASLIGGDGFDWQASRCTYYAASSDLSAEATGADYCCNAVPSAFIAEVGALPGVPRPFDWMAAPRVAFPVVDGRACTADEPPVQSVSSYRVPAITYHDCARASMADGDYFLYAVNTKAAAATLELSYEARSVTAAEAHACYAADYSAANGARGWGRPSAGALLAALLALAACGRVGGGGPPQIVCKIHLVHLQTKKNCKWWRRAQIDRAFL